MVGGELYCLGVTAPHAHLNAYLLAQEARRHTAKTLTHYRYIVGSFVTWLHGQGVSNVDMRSGLLVVMGKGGRSRGNRAWEPRPG